MNARDGIKVMIAAGGSGGHIFPAIALARALASRREVATVRFVGSDKGLDRRIFEKEAFAFDLLSSNKLSPGKKLLLPVFFLKLLLDLARSFLIISKQRPDVVVGFGGYVSCPVIVAGRVLGRRTVLHEQNVSPGRANRFLFRFADRIAVSFNETKKRLGADIRKAAFTGNPIRREMCKDDRLSGIRQFGLDAGKFTILVAGGSQGARRLNESFIRAVAGMDDGLRRGLQVIHLTGVGDYSRTMQEYRSIGVDHRVYSFLDRIEDAYSAADLIVTRAGASAIFEAAHFGRPMILVPYPYAMNHQLENASVFSERGAALVLQESTLTGSSFRDALTGLMADRGRLYAMSVAARKMSVPGAAEALAQIVVQTASGER